jgi:ketosteroid isomerase-like protein
VSQENVDKLKCMDSLLGAGDIAGALAYFHSDVAWTVINAGPMSGSGRGIDSVRALFMPDEQTLDEQRHVTREVGPRTCGT